MSKQTRLTPERRQRIQRMAGQMPQAIIAERFGISARTVARILDDCPDCLTCGQPTWGGDRCQRCEDEVTVDEVVRGMHGVRGEEW